MNESCVRASNHLVSFVILSNDRLKAMPLIFWQYHIPALWKQHSYFPHIVSVTPYWQNWNGNFECNR